MKFLPSVHIDQTSDGNGRCWVIRAGDGYWRYGSIRSLGDDLTLYVQGKNENTVFVGRKSLAEVSEEMRAEKVHYSIANRVADTGEDYLEVRFDIHGGWGEREMAKARVKTEQEAASFLEGQLEKQRRRGAFNVDLL